METIAAYSRSVNETHRICTHDISGHLHLLRFCMDEINEKDGEAPRDLLDRLDEGLEKLEALNKLLKIATRYFNPDEEISAESVAEKALGLTNLYHHKFLDKLNYEVSGNMVYSLDEATLIIEALFGICSTISHFATGQSVKTLTFNLEFNDGEIVIKANVGNISQDEILTLLKSGNENDKTLRRANAHDLLVQNGGEIKYEPAGKEITVRILK
ncbi:MAG: hypothetical protein VX341_06600 [Bdellovibrionota bacterium]|nr:hypothetical protein [Bdellovibrionota bacterium]